MGLDFFECYQILGITGECDWQTIRKKYKSLIQQHHPDRFKENTPEHIASQKSIREFNAAYKTISDYYALNHCLPPSEKLTPPLPANDSKSIRKKRPPVSQQRTTKKANTRRAKPVKRILASSLLTVILIIFIYQSFDEASSENGQEKNIEKSMEISNINALNNIKSPVETPDVIQQSKEQSDLSYSLGASLGEVISIEGEPTSIEGSTWHYGKSSLTFSKGVVSGWHRHPDHPLKLRVTSTPSIIHQPGHIEREPSKVKKPYWQH